MTVERRQDKYVAVCECGWESEPLTSGGFAGDRFCEHVEAAKTVAKGR